MTKDRDPDPAVTSGKGFPLRMFAPTVTEIELTAVSHANFPLWSVYAYTTVDMFALFTHIRFFTYVFKQIYTSVYVGIYICIGILRYTYVYTRMY